MWKSGCWMSGEERPGWTEPAVRWVGSEVGGFVHCVSKSEVALLFLPGRKGRVNQTQGTNRTIGWDSCGCVGHSLCIYIETLLSPKGLSDRYPSEGAVTPRGAPVC